MLTYKVLAGAGSVLAAFTDVSYNMFVTPSTSTGAQRRLCGRLGVGPYICTIP